MYYPAEEGDVGPPVKRRRSGNEGKRLGKYWRKEEDEEAAWKDTGGGEGLRRYWRKRRSGLGLYWRKRRKKGRLRKVWRKGRRHGKYWRRLGRYFFFFSKELLIMGKNWN